MQRGIDSFFKKVATKKEDNEPESPAPLRKRRARVISSDEDEVAESPLASKSRDRKKTRIEEPSKSPNSKKPSLNKLKKTPEKERVDPSAFFGGELKRVEAKKPPKPKDAAIIELEDEDIDKSLMEIDVDESLLKATTNNVKKTPVKTEKPSKKHVEKEESAKKVDKSVKEQPKEVENKTPPSTEKNNVKKEKLEVEEHKQKATPKVEKKKPKQTSTPRVRKDEQSDLETSVLNDEERHERKRMSAILYQKYKNRSSCLNPGSKEVPKGKPNCLAGLTFLVTGVLESLERDEAGSIIKEYGGKVMGTVGKRLNYMIVGEEAGPKKLVTAEELGVKILSEDDFFDLIREKSGGAKQTKDAQVLEKPSTSPKKKHSTKEAAVNVKKEKSEKPPEKKIKKEHDTIKKEKSDTSPDKKIKREHDSNKKEKEELNNNLSRIKKEPESKENVVKPTAYVKPVVSDDMLAWVDKYKPKTVKEIVGQSGAASNVVKLTNWLSKWYINHDGKKKLQKPNPWAKNDDGSFFKAALLSGPPGIGKTTTATLVCKELGFDTVEFNASDTRSKRLLKEQVAELLSTKSLYGFCHGQEQALTKKHILIMDEVDGMAGNEDRGGIQELIGLIKESSVPIICMCNDRNHQKMRSLVNYCYDLRFNRPRTEQIKACVLSICFKEKFKIEPAKLEEIILATNNDIRQTINHISLLNAGKNLDLKSNATKQGEKVAQKDLKIGPWEVVRKVFSADGHKTMSFQDKSDLFFHDYSMAPLFVQQNYLQVTPVGPKSDVMRKVALTADALSLGDLVDKRIRSNSAWSLLPTLAVFSSVMPGEYMCGHFTGQINFPGWLGKYSRANKRSRLAQELHDHTRTHTSGSRLSVRLDYAPYLLAKIVRPLKELGMDGVEESLSVLKEYHLLREDIDSLMELSTWPGKKSQMDAVDGRVKAALTRTYNKEVLAYSYSAAAGVKKKKAELADEAEMLEQENEEGDGTTAIADSDEEKDDDKLENDGLIKAKKKTAASTKASTSGAKASTSKKATGGAAKAKTSTAKAKK